MAAQRIAGKGSLQVEMGTKRGTAGSQTPCFGILGERGNAVKGPEAISVVSEEEETMKGRRKEKKDTTEEDRISVGGVSNVNNGDEWRGS